jgi:hypothetical protein
MWNAVYQQIVISGTGAVGVLFTIATIGLLRLALDDDKIIPDTRPARIADIALKGFLFLFPFIVLPFSLTGFFCVGVAESIALIYILRKKKSPSRSGARST